MKYATATVSLLIIIAVLIPGSDLPDVDIGGYDKLIHMGMFAVWAVAVRHDFSTRALSAIAVVVAGLLFSALTELLQLLVEGRSFDAYDMAADTLGLLVGLLIAKPLLGWLAKFR